MKMKLIYKKMKKFLKTYGKLPHVWILLIIIILSITALLLSIHYMNKYQFLSSLYANIFAGLLTGVIICLVSTIKTMALYKTESHIKWLSNLHEDCLEFMSMSRKLIFYKYEDFKSYDEVNDYIYDVLCFGHEINVTISQSQFKESLAFNPYKYCKKNLNTMQLNKKE